MWRRQTLTIANGTARSQVLNLSENGAHRRVNLSFWVPAAVAETITVYLGPDYIADAANASYLPFQSGGSNFTLPSGKVTRLYDIDADALVLVAGVNVAAQRVITIRGNTWPSR